ncbi:acetylpolyamine aminohydrolase [Legionella maioricensis]|uniref:Acetylpolyamine aminohydrolase n=1 Tax=Legionella maioricensis TaxID=2896528 RepID=A0A9X2D178_9GAMM|nr:acetylpolyamine aminohydrolase [Legionella maioricensis]MCL9684730.1 acetylpolyamine aminohydrolase [Legionella maioricensis]MCL9687758.1 acetylpolyamine aminohydrolase [Legionella maioricensis]
MKRKFFKETPLSLLEKKILSCITNINSLDPEEWQTVQEYLLELEKYAQNTEFENVRAGLKKEVQKWLSSELMNTELPECLLQIPSEGDIEQMNGMPAGGAEDQSARLMHMTQTIKKEQEKHTLLSVINTEQVDLRIWNELFAAINKGSKKEAFQQLRHIASEDTLLQSILAVHPIDYLEKIISYSIEAQRTGVKKINADITISPNTFELLIKDIATTLKHPAKCHFSFGLPTHHAFSREGSGFCIFNKIAILMKHAELTHQKPLRYVIIGTDVNRDNGLCNVLRESLSHMSICHIDIFDSRVYPCQDHAFIDYEFKAQGNQEKQGIKSWRQNQMEYFAVDLKLTTRSSVSVHPALLFALDKIKEHMAHAKENEQKIVIYLPTGWDSHENETAFCGKFISDRMMTSSEATRTRYNDGDLTFFYERIFTLYKENKECIENIYWGLEGGYDRPMYERQIKLMLQTIDDQLLQPDSNQSLHRINY